MAKTLSFEDHVRAQALLEEARRSASCPFRTYFPDTGPLRRALYPRSMEFIAAGGLRDAQGNYVFNERLFMAANRTSKTVTCAYESTAHLTGQYPTWWPGRKFDGPIEMWTAGDTHETTRDIIQLAAWIVDSRTGEFERYTHEPVRLLDDMQGFERR